MSDELTRWVDRVRWLAKVEAISFLVLLGGAMPLKYLADLPVAVKLVGWVHGGLFVALCVLLAHVALTTSWPARRALLVFVAALVPFGPFLIDRQLSGRTPVGL